MSDPKRHHYLNQAYLKEFTADDERICVYDRELDQYLPNQVLRNVAVRKHYYSFTRRDGTKDPAIEKALSPVEGSASKIVESLTTETPITAEDRATLALFVALLIVRTPAWQRQVDQMLRMQVEHIRDLMLETPETRADMVSRWSSAGYSEEQMEEVHKASTVKIEREGSLQFMQELAVGIATDLLALDWECVHNRRERHAFVVSDSPTIVDRPPGLPKELGAGLATPGAKMHVPLTQKLVLTTLAPGTGVLSHRSAEDGEMRRLNLRSTRNTERYLFACSERLLRSLVTETKIGRTPPPNRSDFSGWKRPTGRS